jgi:hypothetical protein
MKICCVGGCNRAARARGLCRKHYVQHWEKGTHKQFEKIETTREWLVRHANWADSKNCLLWPFSCDTKGCPQTSIKVRGKTSYFNAGRFMCELAHGAPPTPQHKVRRSCKNKLCVNPQHMRWHYYRVTKKPLTGRNHWPAVWIHSHVEYEGDDCLFWPFQRHKKGYGKIGLEGSDGRSCTYAPHAIMCELKHGYKPTPEHQAAHSCGNGAQGCCNPNHLFWRTADENNQERLLHAKIRKSKLSRKTLAKKYGISESLIGCIRREWL